MFYKLLIVKSELIKPTTVVKLLLFHFFSFYTRFTVTTMVVSLALLKKILDHKFDTTILNPKHFFAVYLAVGTHIDNG